MYLFVLVLVGIIAVLLLFYCIAVFNGLIGLRNDIRKSWANIDVLLKQRSDELPNLIEAVKGYMKHEQSVLTTLTKLRTSVLQASSLGAKAKADDGISAALKTIFAVSENYPKLQANENFLKLQTRISELENQLADRREFYNDTVTNYNTRIQSFPDMAFAKLFSFQQETLFKATEQEKKVVPVKITP